MGGSAGIGVIPKKKQFFYCLEDGFGQNIKSGPGSYFVRVRELFNFVFTLYELVHTSIEQHQTL